jgi:hypothetical protein
LWQIGVGGKTVNESLKTRFVADLSRFTGARPRFIVRDARTFLTFSKDKRTKAELTNFSCTDSSTGIWHKMLRPAGQLRESMRGE